MTYADLQNALRVMGLGERATLREIKARHRELVKRHHPDTCATDDPNVIRNVNAAHRVRIWIQFADDPLWSGK